MAQLKDLLVLGPSRFLGNIYGTLKGNADTATKATQDSDGNIITSKYVTVDTAQTISGSKTITADLLIGASGAGGRLIGSATNGGCNSIRIGDDAYLGDVNVGGVIGIKPYSSTGASSGISFRKGDGTEIGRFYADSTNLITTKSLVPSANNSLSLGTSGAAYTGVYSNLLVANNANSGAAGGIALYGTEPTTYGIAMRQTSNGGTHGYVTNDWATYFYMHSNSASTPNRGWIFKDPRVGNAASINCNGDTWLRRLNVAGTSTSDTAAGSYYATGGLEIRESGRVGNAQSTFAYAPRIGFHWSQRIAASLSFHSDGVFYLRKQDGATRATLDANLNGNAATASKLQTYKTDMSGTYGDSYPLYAWWETGSIVKLKCDNYTTKVDEADKLDGKHLSEIAAAKSTTLAWGTQSTIATIGGNNINVTLPANPNTNTSHTTFAWTNGTTAGPTGSLSGNHTAVSFSAIPSASDSISGIVTTGAQTFAGNKTFKGHIYPQATTTYNLGSENLKWKQIFVNDFIKVDQTSAGSGLGFISSYGGQQVARLACNNIGTTSALGSGVLIVGNSVAKGTDKNAQGQIRIYSELSNYHNILGVSGANRNHILPNYDGWIVTAGDGSSTGAGSSSLPVYISSSGQAIACSTTLGVSITGNAATASKLATSRTISLTGSVTGSGSFDGSGNLSIATTTNHTHNYAGSASAGGSANSALNLATTVTANSGNTANRPWHRICYTNALSATYRDTEALVLFEAYYDGGGCGLAKIALRGNNTSTPNISINWLFNNGFATDDLYYGIYNGTNGANYYADIYLKRGAWSRTNVIVLANPGGWTFVNSNEGNDGSSYTEVYTGINARSYSSTAKATFVIRADQVYGAVWNDYAEYRHAFENYQAGTVVLESPQGLIKSTARLQKGGAIVTDTFGFAIGETDEAKIPIAVSGRAFAYTDKPRSKFKPGDPVCSGKNGTVSKMNRLECILFPDRILGIVSEIPNYEEWGTGKVKVNNRIWIKIK